MLPKSDHHPNLAFKYRNSLNRCVEACREKLILLSESEMKKYPVFLDREIGISKRYRNTITDIEFDEDYDSSDEIVSYGLKECLKILKDERGDGENGGSCEFLSQEECDNKSTVKARYRSQRSSSMTVQHQDSKISKQRDE